MMPASYWPPDKGKTLLYGVTGRCKIPALTRIDLIYTDLPCGLGCFVCCACPQFPYIPVLKSHSRVHAAAVVAGLDDYCHFAAPYCNIIKVGMISVEYMNSLDLIIISLAERSFLW